MVGFLMFLFIVLCVLLTLFILIQSGKGDLGLGALGGGSQMLFGGSGGQDFFEKITWIMGAIFIIGALGLTLLKNKESEQSRVALYSKPIKTQQQNLPANMQQKTTSPIEQQPIQQTPTQTPVNQ